MTSVSISVLNSTAIYLKNNAVFLRFYEGIEPDSTSDSHNSTLLLVWPLVSDNMSVTDNVITFNGLDLSDGLTDGEVDWFELATADSALYRDDITGVAMPVIKVSEPVLANGFQIVIEHVQ